MSILICPVCGGALNSEKGCRKCENGHSFDVAKEGYVNLLIRSHKSGDTIGDSREMALSRHRFLERGAFSPLKSAIRDYVNRFDICGNMLDICCGEGYYSSALSGVVRDVYAFDLSKNMVRLAAKRSAAHCFVANISKIPIKSDSIDCAVHLFAPFHDGEFSRIMNSNGVLLTAVAGKRHLMGMKEVLYDHPYENDEQPPAAPSFTVADKITVRADITLTDREDIAALLNMTPYGVHSPAEGKRKLLALDRLDTLAEFVIFVMKKRI